jgi:acetyltransferase-like isoleucine patch superfamily enzyme
MIRYFIIDIFVALRHFLAQHYQLAKLKNNNPTCHFYPQVQIENVTFGEYCIAFQNVRMANCIIGSHTYVQKGTSIFNATIGKFCSIAANVSIGPGKHKMDGVSLHPSFYLKNTPLAKTFVSVDHYTPSAETKIGNDVWIGERAIVLDGVTIGDGAIIAAGSVVTKDVSAFAIVGGTPAKLIRMRLPEETINVIQDSRWWLKTEDELINMRHLFYDVEQFVKTMQEK